MSARVVLHRDGASSFESSAYEADYRGLRIRIERLTDPNDDGAYYGKSATETRWDGFILAEGETSGGYNNVVAECFPTRRAALAATLRAVDRRVEAAS